MTNEQKQTLYDRQVQLLRTFLAHGTITEAQFQKSFGDLTAKMFPQTAQSSAASADGQP